MATVPLTPPPAPSRLEGEVSRLRQILATGEHQRVIDAALPLLAEFPLNRDLLLMAAIALRHLRQTEAALAMLDRLAEQRPGYSQMLLEQGLCHVALRDAPRAIAALEAAVSANPALQMGWRMLDGLGRMTGDAALVERAGRNSTFLASIPPEVIDIKSLFADGEIDPAETRIRAWLLAHGDHPEAMRVLAQIGFTREVFDDAELLYAGVLAMVPDHHDARSEYVQTLIQRHKFAEAADALEPLLKLDDRNPQWQQHAATVAIGLGNQEPAIAIYRRLLADLPANAPPGAFTDYNLWLGHALKTVGDVPGAIEAYRAAATRQDFGDAWWSLANLKTYRFTDEELGVIGAAEADPATAAVDRANLAFALGKAMEDRKDYAASWAAYARGNAAQRTISRYRPEIFETNTREQKRVCTAAFFTAQTGWGDPAPDPIFVLGLPRSGSTLIEQILASHSMVEGTMELPNIARIVHELQGRDMDWDNPRYPAVLPELDAATVRGYGARFIAETRPFRTLGRARFIDKMPNNFRHLGLIHLILPNAKIIDARRNPMDCCFSNLKQNFAQGQEFTYSIEDIARYYRTYLELMQHWDAVLPGRVLRVLNEDLIDDPEGQIRRMLDHCGLPFEAGCLNFHQNTRSVRTPSSEQVRRPISRDGVDQWKPYAPWLGELTEALGDALETWRA